MKTLRTAEMNDTFSLAEIVAVSFHLFCNWSTECFILLRYLRSCSSAVGTRFLHSAIALSFAFAPVDLIRSCCLLTRSLCAARVVCHFSSFEGSARLSKMSKKVSFSIGGNVSQSSWYELLMNDEFRECSFGVLGVEGWELGVRGSGRCPSSLLDCVAV